MNAIHEARVQRDLNSVMSEVDGLLGTITDEGAQTLQGLRDRVASVASSARTKLSTLDTSMRDNARYAARATDDYVHHNPWRAIGAGVVTGLLIGYLVSRR